MDFQTKNCSHIQGENNWFGIGLDIEGNNIIVGCPYDDLDAGGANTIDGAGAAYIYTYDGTSWNFAQKVIASDRAIEGCTMDAFGECISLSGDYVLIGSKGNDLDVSGSNSICGAGAAYIFENNSGTWAQFQKIVANNRNMDDYFAKSVCINGNNILVGAVQEDEDEANTLSNSGSIYFFENGTYTPIIWKGPEPGHWTNGTGPTALDDAIIDWLYDEPANIECSDLIVNETRNLEIQPDYFVKTHGVLINNGVVKLVSPDNMGISGQFISLAGIINNGTMQAERYLFPDSWHLIGSPMEDMIPILDVLEDDIAYWYDESYNGPENNDAWIPCPESEYLYPAVGYLVQVPSEHNITSKIVFEGTFNQGAGLWANMPLTYEGFNMIANPYPATIDWNAANGWTKNNITGTTYVWTSGGNEWNSALNGYATWNGTVGTLGGSRYIPPMQAFFIQVTSDMDNSITATTEVCVTENISFKTAVANLIRLQTTGNGYIDETVIYFSEENNDSKKLFGTQDVPSVYSIENNENLVINCLQDTKEYQKINIGFKCSKSDYYTIDVTEFTFSNQTNIVLEDTKTGTLTTMSQDKTYTFYYETTDSDERFILHFNYTSADGAVSVYLYNKNVYINGLEAGTVSIYNLLGQKVMTTYVQSEISTGLPTGMYIVKIQSENQTATKKVYIK